MIDWEDIQDDDPVKIGEYVLVISLDKTTGVCTRPVAAQFTSTPEGGVGYKVGKDFVFPTHYAQLNLPKVEKEAEIKGEIND